MAKMSKDAANKLDAPMNRVIQFFVAGCAAELYLLIFRRFYITGSTQQMLNAYAALPWLIGIGAVVLALGLIVLVPRWRQKKPSLPGWILSFTGAFLAASALIIRFLGPTALTLMCVVVPVAVLLSVLWVLYERECAWSLTVLGTALIVLWVCRRLVESINFLGVLTKVCAVVYLLLVAAVAFVVYKAEKNNGVYGRFRLFPAGADVLPIYVSCGLTIVAVAAALFSATVAYYAMWVLALVVFALAVYYTVKQL